MDSDSEREPLTDEELRTIGNAMHAARRAARKLEIMYKRGEVSPRAELDGLIEALGGHDIPGIWAHGMPCGEARALFGRLLDEHAALKRELAIARSRDVCFFCEQLKGCREVPEHESWARWGDEPICLGCYTRVCVEEGLNDETPWPQLKLWDPTP